MSAEASVRRRAERERLLALLRAELSTLLPAGETVWIFGSLTNPERFSDHSDIDLALVRRPPPFSEFWLQGELELRLGRRVDVVILSETRLRGKIETEGVKWIM